jgi:hypothetical protein
MPGHDKLAIAMLRSKSKDLRLNSETHLSYIAESTFCFELTTFSRMKKLLNRLHSHITGMRVESDTIGDRKSGRDARRPKSNY